MSKNVKARLGALHYSRAPYSTVQCSIQLMDTVDLGGWRCRVGSDLEIHPQCLNPSASGDTMDRSLITIIKYPVNCKKGSTTGHSMDMLLSTLALP